MAGKKSKISFRTKSGKRISFKATSKKKSNRSPAAIKKSMQKLNMSPKMITRALAAKKRGYV